MAKIGYIKLHRKIQDNPFWMQPRKFSKAEAWIDILMEVRWSNEPQSVVIKNTVFVCNRGESLNSYGTWADRWHWTISAARRFLLLLQSLNQIELVNEQQTTRLSVVNYSTYQDERIANESQMKSKRKANESQMKTEEEREERKKDKKLFSENSDPYKISHQLHQNILSLGLNVKQPDLQAWAKHVDYMIRIDKIPADDILRGLVWIKADPGNGEWPGWGAVILSTKKLRAKWQTIQLRMNTPKPEKEDPMARFDRIRAKGYC